MIFEVRLSNFYSFKEEAVLDMRASNSRSSQAIAVENNVFTANKERLLKIVCMYGANASGKSNFIKAMRFCCRLVLFSHLYNENDVFNFKKFKFDGYENKPSHFSIRFIDNNIEYLYGFSLSKNTVLTEYLYHYPNGRKAIIFTRDESKPCKKDKYRFGSNIKRPFDVATNTSNKTLYISRASQLDRDIGKQIFLYFNEQLLLGYVNIDDLAMFQKYKSKILHALKIVDSDIINLEIKHIRQPVKNYKHDLKKMKLAVEDKIEDHFEILSFHRANQKQPFNFLGEESEGTKKLFFVLLRLFNVFEHNKTILIDEIEHSFHDDLLQYIFDLFRDSKAQLICSTHNTSLLDLNKMRKEQIVFVEKDKNGASSMFTAYDFPDFRDTMDLEKAYKNGRFGAVPHINIYA